MLLYLHLNEDLRQENYIAWIANEATGHEEAWKHQITVPWDINTEDKYLWASQGGMFKLFLLIATHFKMNARK